MATHEHPNSYEKKPGNLPVYPNSFYMWQLTLGGNPHARVRNTTDLMYDFKVLIISSFGDFLNFLNLKIRAGKILAKKNTFRDAINTFLIFQ